MHAEGTILFTCYDILYNMFCLDFKLQLEQHFLKIRIKKIMIIMNLTPYQMVKMNVKKTRRSFESLSKLGNPKQS